MIYRFLLTLALGGLLSLSVAAQEYVPGYERGEDIGEGAELVLVYFGSADCGPCQIPEIKAAMERAKVALFERAQAEGKAFAVIGVALDLNVERGLAFLSSSGRFDEVSVGRNWFNSAALAHVWRSEGLESRTPAMPGVMVFERDMRFGDAGIAASAPAYLVELVGPEDIPAWAAAGTPLE